MYKNNEVGPIYSFVFHKNEKEDQEKSLHSFQQRIKEFQIVSSGPGAKEY